MTIAEDLANTFAELISAFIVLPPESGLDIIQLTGISVLLNRFHALTLEYNEERRLVRQTV